MAFKAFDQNKDTKEFLPWADKYLKENPLRVGDTWDVIEVKTLPKGMVLECDDWAVWLFKSKALHQYVLDFIGAWYKSNKPAPVLQLMLTKNEPFFTIGADDERQACWCQGEESKYWHQSYWKVQDNPKQESNPLPLPTDSPRSLPHEASNAHLPADAKTLLAETSSERPLEASTNGTTPSKRRKTSKEG